MTSQDSGEKAVLMPSDLEQAAAGLIRKDDVQFLNTTFTLAKTALNATHLSNPAIEQQLSFIVIVSHCVAKQYALPIEIGMSNLAAISLDLLLSLNDVMVLPLCRFKE